jgi:hypothetical protein
LLEEMAAFLESGILPEISQIVPEILARKAVIPSKPGDFR